MQIARSVATTKAQERVHLDDRQQVQVKSELQPQERPADPIDVPLETTAVALANTDFKKALDWLAQIQDPDLHLQAALAIGNEGIRKDPVAALDLIVTLEPSPQRDDLIRRGAAEWALSDANKAVKWSAQIDDEDLRANVIAAIATSWSDSSPSSAAKLVMDELPEGRLQSDTLVSIIQRWAQANPQSVAKWVEQFPDGELKSAAANNLLAIWSRLNAGDAARWKASVASLGSR